MRERLIELIDAARATALEPHRNLLLERLQRCAQLANAGEEGIALEWLCDNLHEYDVQISRDFLTAIGDVGSYFGVPSDRYRFMRELVK
jgi:hypothetical protein